VPNQYSHFVRVPAPAPTKDWWPAYRDLFDVVASIGARHTSCPERAWFAVWEGHGFATATTHVAHQGPADDETRRSLEQERSRLRDQDRRRHADIRAALHRIPRFELPNRTYYLLEGPLTAVAQLRDPGHPGDWRHPDLLWPDDRRWFVATDVDFWSLYIGGYGDFISELVDGVPSATEVVTLDRPLEIED